MAFSVFLVGEDVVVVVREEREGMAERVSGRRRDRESDFARLERSIERRSALGSFGFCLAEFDELDGYGRGGKTAYGDPDKDAFE